MDITRRTLVGLGLAGFAPRAARAQAQVTLQFWEGHSLQEETATIRMIQAFETANPTIKIERTKVAFQGHGDVVDRSAKTRADRSRRPPTFVRQIRTAAASLEAPDSIPKPMHGRRPSSDG